MTEIIFFTCSLYHVAWRIFFNQKKKIPSSRRWFSEAKLPDVRIVTISEPSVISQALPGNRNERLCYLCHEIGAGHWYGYLWEDDVGNFFKLIDKPRSIASCMHTDTLDEMKEILFSSELNVAEEDFRKLDFILFMRLERNGWETTPPYAST